MGSCRSLAQSLGHTAPSVNGVRVTVRVAPTIGSSALTRTQKVRRRFIAERYEPLIEALYDGSTEKYVSTEVTFEDGRKGELSATVRISDAETYPAAADELEAAE